MLHAPSTTLNDKLRLSASKGQTAKVLELLEAGAKFDADREGRNALHLAAHHGHSDTVAALTLAGCDVNTPDFVGHAPLQCASAEGHVDIVKQLIKHGAHIDHQDEVHGNTATHEAAWKGYSQTLEALCKAKANIYIKNKGGFTPLHLACQNGHNQSCRILLLAGCKPDIKNNYGDTPTHTSSRYGHAGTLRILISARCKASEQNKNGDTALHISSAMGRRKLTRILLEAGLDVNIKNKQDETALTIAERKGFSEVAEILKNPPPSTQVRRDDEVGRKKREKDSGTSRDSKESDCRARDKKKSKYGHKVHFPDAGDGGKTEGMTKNHKSPYGCHYSPNMNDFPSVKLDSLPKDPLRSGEQYYLDLAGNIRKGPIGVGCACYCVPFFQHVEKKLENDKQELLEHIDLAHDDLQAKLTHLERRTRTHLHTLHQAMQERMAEERVECQDRVERTALRERHHSNQMQNRFCHWLSNKLNNRKSNLKRTVSQEEMGTLDRNDPQFENRLPHSRSYEDLSMGFGDITEEKQESPHHHYEAPPSANQQSPNQVKYKSEEMLNEKPRSHRMVVEAEVLRSQNDLYNVGNKENRIAANDSRLLLSRNSRENMNSSVPNFQAITANDSRLLQVRTSREHMNGPVQNVREISNDSRLLHIRNSRENINPPVHAFPETSADSRLLHLRNSRENMSAPVPNFLETSNDPRLLHVRNSRENMNDPVKSVVTDPYAARARNGPVQPKNIVRHNDSHENLVVSNSPRTLNKTNRTVISETNKPNGILYPPRTYSPLDVAPIYNKYNVSLGIIQKDSNPQHQPPHPHHFTIGLPQREVTPNHVHSANHVNSVPQQNNDQALRRLDSLMGNLLPPPSPVVENTTLNGDLNNSTDYCQFYPITSEIGIPIKEPFDSKSRNLCVDLEKQQSSLHYASPGIVTNEDEEGSAQEPPRIQEYFISRHCSSSLV